MTCYICDKHPQVRKGSWCSDCKTQFNEIFHKKPGRPVKYQLDKFELNETRFYPVVTGKEQHAIRCTMSLYGKQTEKTFSCTAIPGGLNVTRTS